MKRNNKMVYIISIAIIIILGLIGFIQEERQEVKQPQYIRFHVIANSDSPEDQELKLRVRNLILERFKYEFEEISSIEDSRKLIREHLDEFESIARQEILRSGKTYGVKAQLGIFEFPTKAYGNLVLPAGEYEALRVVIGEGNGANWWCVMFPPLCFVDITHGTAKKPVEYSDSEISLQTVKNRAVRVEYRFKLAEWWNRILSFLRIGQKVA